jgi:hypothetical protein
VAVIVRGVPAAGLVGLMARVKELGRDTEPPPMETAFLVEDADGYG